MNYMFHPWQPYFDENNIEFKRLTRGKMENGITLAKNTYIFSSAFENIEASAIILENSCHYVILERTKFHSCKDKIFKFSSQNEVFSYFDKVCISESLGIHLSQSKSTLMIRDSSIFKCGNGTEADFFLTESKNSAGETVIQDMNMTKNNYQQCSGISFINCKGHISTSMFDGNTQKNIFFYFQSSEFSVSRSVFQNIIFSSTSTILHTSNNVKGSCSNCIFKHNTGTIAFSSEITVIHSYIENTDEGSANILSSKADSGFDLRLIDEFGCNRLPRIKSEMYRMKQTLSILLLVSLLSKESLNSCLQSRR